MEDIKKKILEKLKKLSEEEREKREKIHEAKLEGGDSPDNQDYQFNLETLIRIKQEKSNLQSRLEEIEREEREEKEELERKLLKPKLTRKSFSIPIVGKEFELLVNDSRKIKVKIVPLYEEIESNENYYSITTEAPLSKILEKLMDRLLEKFIDQFEKKIQDIVNAESNHDNITKKIIDLEEWQVIQNHSKFTSKIKELSKDRSKLLKEIDNFIKQAEINQQKLLKYIIGQEFFLKVQGKDIKYKILNV